MKKPKHWDTLDLRDVAWQKKSKLDAEWSEYAKMPRKQALRIVLGKE